MSAIFVSYARADLSFVRELRSELVKSGHEVWLDVEQIALDDDWLAAIEAAVEHAEALVFVVSRESLRSESCMHELRLAAAHRKRIIALSCGGVEDKSLPEELASSESILTPCRHEVAAVREHLDQTL